jgi:phage gpG-like protein
MLNVHLEISGEVQFSRSFTRFAEQLTDLRDLWPGVVTDLRESIEEQFDSEGGAGKSGAWPSLSKSYAAWKSRKFPGKPILQRTGRLVKSLTGNSPDTIVDPKPDSLEFGTRVPYAKYHQRGAGKLPRRRLIDLNERQKARLMKTIQRRLLQAGRDAGFTLG